MDSHPSFIDQLQANLIEIDSSSPADFIGCTAEEIAQLCEKQGSSKLPGLYLQFLQKMGRQAGRLFVGCEVFYSAQIYFDFREVAEEILEINKVVFEIPKSAFVFLNHQGYIFMYFDTETNEYDPELIRYSEGTDSYPVAIGRFSELLTKELKLHRSLAEYNKNS